MPLSRAYRRSLKPLQRFYKLRQKPDHRPPRQVRNTGWLMTVTMAAVTAWSAYDGHRSPGMMAAAALAAVAAMNVLAYAAALLPQTRLLSALFSGLWVLLFMPGWDWLAGQYAYPATWWSAATFAVLFGVLRYAMTRN